jgi:hypothetical protein
MLQNVHTYIVLLCLNTVIKLLICVLQHHHTYSCAGSEGTGPRHCRFMSEINGILNAKSQFVQYKHPVS